jgi:hypothetical protein
MNKNLRRAIKNAEEKLNKAYFAIQDIEGHLTFFRFGKEKPQLTTCNCNEIILKYLGNEMPIEDVLERMENVGYITP